MNQTIEKYFGRSSLGQHLTSAVTTRWGVNWDEVQIARDVLQNFYDENQKQLDEVLVWERFENQDGTRFLEISQVLCKVKCRLGAVEGHFEEIEKHFSTAEETSAFVDAIIRRGVPSPRGKSGLKRGASTFSTKAIVITAPQSCRLERLFYLGSEKGADKVGQYGEGFKAAALCLLRDMRVNLFIGSEDRALELKISNIPVSNTGLFPLEYQFYETETFCGGTKLILENCSPPLIEALKEGLNHFFYADNQLLGEKLWSCHRSDYLIFKSKAKSGCIFYRGLKRGDLQLPFILVAKTECKRIEKKIRNDRDRNAFGEEIMADFFTFFGKQVARDRDALKTVLQLSSEVWHRGHPFLRAVSEAMAYPEGDSFGREVFGDRYFAKISKFDSANWSYSRQQVLWESEGRVALDQYFARFGVLCPKRFCERLAAKLKLEAHSAAKRLPTDAEWDSIKLMATVLRVLAQDIASIFNKSLASYTVVQSESLLGELRSDRHYRSYEVFLAESLFIGEFADALKVYLHEHAHIFGRDGSRGFSDSLTELLGQAIRHRKMFNEMELRWHLFSERIKAERSIRGGLQSHRAWLESQTHDFLVSALSAGPTSIIDELKLFKERGNLLALLHKKLLKGAIK